MAKKGSAEERDLVHKLWDRHFFVCLYITSIVPAVLKVLNIPTDLRDLKVLIDLNKQQY